MAGNGELVAVRADRVVDVEAGEVRAGRVVLVRGERIEAVLDPGRPVPEGAALVDLPGHTLLPGLIDCHTHLVGELQGSGIPAVDRSAAQEALSGVGNARATVMAGFTTVRDVGTFRAFVDVALRDAIRDGTVAGPRMAVAGAYVTVPGGGGAVTGLAPDIKLPRDLRFGEAASPAEVRQRVRAILYGGAVAPGRRPHRWGRAAAPGGQVPGVGVRRQLVQTTGKVLALKQTMPDLVILPAHDRTAAQWLPESEAGGDHGIVREHGHDPTTRRGRLRVPRGLRERPSVEPRDRRDQEGLPRAGGGRNHLPPDPFGAQEEG
jgi:hypothetical protein